MNQERRLVDSIREKPAAQFACPHASWLWPDHNIGKRESRRLREEHNRLINDYVEAKVALAEMVNAYAPRADWTDTDNLHSAVYKAGVALGIITEGENSDERN